MSAMTENERDQIQDFGRHMWHGWRGGVDPYRAERCKTLHENCQLMLNGKDSPELRVALKKNLDDLQRYDDGEYNHLIG